MLKRYCGIRLRQRRSDDAPTLFVFFASAKDVITWATVDRLEEREGGIQRKMSQARLRAIEKFFVDDARNIIPTAIVLAFEPGTTRYEPSELPPSPSRAESAEGAICDWGVLSFECDPNIPEIKRPALVVDGQHRLFGAARVEQEDLTVLVSAMLDVQKEEQAFQFVVINNKVTRVPSDLVRSLIVDFNEQALQERLKTARVSLSPQALLVAIVDEESESPLYQMVDWERRRGKGKPAIKPAAIEDSLAYARRRFAILSEDQDALFDFFFAVWRGIKAVYPILWERIDNRLFENAGFKSFSEYLTDQLQTLEGIGYTDVLKPESVEDAARTIASQIDVDFWLAEWKLKSLDTSTGREIVKDDLTTIRQNRKAQKSWWEDLSLLGASSEHA